jgi:hypothetical protein
VKKKMLKILLLFVAVSKAFAIIAADAGNNNNTSTDRGAVISTAHAAAHRPSTTHSEPMNFAKSDLLYLSELPLEQLLKVKKSIDEIQQVSRRAPPHQHDNVNLYRNNDQIISEIGVVVEEPRPSVGTTMQSRAMDESGGGRGESKGFFNFVGGKLMQALIGGRSQQQQPQAINRKTGYGGSGLEDPWEQKQSKIQTFFQLSITALAFLAFAGYLLCMIVQAIKAKGMHAFLFHEIIELEIYVKFQIIDGAAS